jgi:hypothetical protein
VKIVITQSMYFPWIGLLEQLKIADVLVRYDDVQFSKGSFTNRVQIKTASGPRWMTVPLQKYCLNQKINEVHIDETKNWRENHLGQLENAYSKAPFYQEMMDLVRYVFSHRFNAIGDLAYLSQMSLFEYFSINPKLCIHRSEDLQIAGFGSQRVKDTVIALKGTEYVTGHGAMKYLDHEAMESGGIDVQYMDYEKLPYPQISGIFTPYVSALDLLANCGKQGADYIRSNTCNWRIFKHEST